MSPVIEARRPISKSALGDRLRKSNSSEPLATHDEEPSSSSDEEGNSENSRTASRLASRLSVSMSHLKTTINLDKELNESGDSQPSDTSAFKMKALADDDVFTDNPPRDSKDLAPIKDDESAVTRVEGREFAKFLDGPVAVDAQDIYPPSACIFVANLTQTKGDAILEAEVTRVFSDYGTVFVKIRRDQKNMPFAFCQYTCDEDAKAAVAYSHGTMILGRPCRVEKAKANSTFIVYKHSGMPTEERDAFQLLDPLGEISSIEPLDADVQADMKIPDAMVVQFKLYDPRRDIRKATQQDRRFVVRDYEPNIASPETRREAEIRAEEMAEYDRDRRSAYFGNLPLDTTQDEMSEMAHSSGQVRGLRLYHKSYKGGPIVVCFAFVEFSRPDSVDDAIRIFHGKDLRGNAIRVERKQSRALSGNQERDWKVPIKLPNYAQSPKPWRAPDLSYAGPSRIANSSSVEKGRWTTESPVAKSFSTALSSPTESTISRSATISHRQSNQSPAARRGLTFGTPSRSTYSPSAYGSLRPNTARRTHVRDIFGPTEQQKDPQLTPSHELSTTSSSHSSHARTDSESDVREGYTTPDQDPTPKAQISVKGKAVARDPQLASHGHRLEGTLNSRDSMYNARISKMMTDNEYSPPQESVDYEDGGAAFDASSQLSGSSYRSPASLASTMPNMPSMPGTLEQPGMPTLHPMPGMDQHMPYYGYHQMSPYQMPPMPHYMGPLTPYHHPSMMAGGPMGMPFLPPPPYPDHYSPYIFTPPPALPTMTGRDEGQVTPTRYTHHRAPSREHHRRQSKDAKNKTEQPSTQADPNRYRAQCHERRESQETQTASEESTTSEEQK